MEEQKEQKRNILIVSSRDLSKEVKSILEIHGIVIIFDKTWALFQPDVIARKCNYLVMNISVSEIKDYLELYKAVLFKNFNVCILRNSFENREEAWMLEFKEAAIHKQIKA